MRNNAVMEVSFLFWETEWVIASDQISNWFNSFSFRGANFAALIDCFNFNLRCQARTMEKETDQQEILAFLLSSV